MKPLIKDTPKEDNLSTKDKMLCSKCVYSETSNKGHSSEPLSHNSSAFLTSEKRTNLPTEDKVADPKVYFIRVLSVVFIVTLC